MGRRTSRAAVVLASAVALTGALTVPASADYWHPFGAEHVCALPQPIAVAGAVDPWVPDAAVHYGDPVSPHGAAVYASATGFAAGSTVTITHAFTRSTTKQQRVRVGKRVVVRKVVERVTRSVVLGRITTDCWGQFAAHHLQPVAGPSTGTLRLDGTTWQGTPFTASSTVVMR